MIDSPLARFCAIVGAPVALIVCIKAWSAWRSATSRVPGPWYSKWTGAVLDYHWLRGTRCQYVEALHRRYGRIVRIAPREVDVCDIDAVKTIYAVRETFLKSPWYQHFTTLGVQTLFNTNDVDFHRRHRRLLSGPIAESSLRVYWPQINACCERAVGGIGAEMAARGAADVFKWWTFFSTDVIGELTFGESFHMVEQGQKTEYSRMLEDTGSTGIVRSVFPAMVAIAKVVPLPYFSRAVKFSRLLTQYAGESLARYKALLEADPGRAKTTLFTNLFKASETDGLCFDEIRNEAEVYIVGGSDTTSITLTYLVWAVCRHAHVKAALVKELQQLPDGFDDQQLKALPYLGQVISETLRLYPAAPSGLPRLVPPGGAELCGYRLDAGVSVCAQAHSMHRDAAVWRDPDVFDPSRWAAPTRAMKDAFMAWGRGARGCIGMHLAQMELRLATARFFLAFPDASVHMSDDDMAPVIHFLLSPKGKHCLIGSELGASSSD